MTLICKCEYDEAELLEEGFTTFTVGKSYKVEVMDINSMYESNPYIYRIMSDCGIYVHMRDDDELSVNYIYNYFHTIDEIRDLKLVDLGI